jgi:hypothetical protein
MMKIIKANNNPENPRREEANSIEEVKKYSSRGLVKRNQQES